MDQTNQPEGISDPVLNCLLDVCCLTLQEATAALAKAMVDAGVCDREHAPGCAKWLREYFDLAPAGSLKAFKTVIARLAQG